MKLYSWILFLLLTCVACGKKTATEQTETEEHHEETNVVALTEEQMKAVGVSLGSIEMKNLSTSISVSGTLEVPSQNKALITSLAGGVLKSLRIQPGDYVKKGQVVGTIANTELSNIQQQLVSINAQIQFSQKEVERQRTLVNGNAAPYKNLQKAQAELDGLQAQRTALRQQLSALGVSSSGDISSSLAITAPISGTISDISAQIGSQINASSPIAQIINNSELHLDLFVYEKDLPKLAKGQTIHFTLTNNPGKEYDAQIYAIGTAFVNETKAVPVHAHVVNDKQGLIEGMSVTARISLGDSVYPSVPDEAIVSNEGKDYIFIVSNKKAEEHADEHGHEHKEGEKSHDEKEVHMQSFERVQVIRGASDVGYTEIKPVLPLAPGTQIATKGAFFLIAKMTNAGEAHEH